MALVKALYFLKVEINIATAFIASRDPFFDGLLERAGTQEVRAARSLRRDSVRVHFSGAVVAGVELDRGLLAVIATTHDTVLAEVVALVLDQEEGAGEVLAVVVRELGHQDHSRGFVKGGLKR